jgi:ribosomal protein S18 acetylase RimI-like enzyme
LPEERERPQFTFEPLDKRKHDRAAFSCGNEQLDNYLKHQASQDLEKRVAAVVVLTSDGKTIAGYYTLSQYSIDLVRLPKDVVKKLKLPKYPEVPATLLGRLARSTAFQGHGIGELLLMGALKRAFDQSRSVASVAVVVDAIDERARAFYLRYGFIELPDRPDRLFLPMVTIEQMF